ncbi:MAG: alpha/beta hydrolase [Microbacterium sp. 67-17]|uniref:alpha/beta hydrolase n=1 Tax=Microbacterium sp. 67-17 TaxID=1895782 RepID=UPI000960E676|nr:alpha/beta hydrolase [Microbacterium sp. 67-17]OJV96369.1 MAG: alpha/beta hydrolase [Microbacterium sp. 67-17]
MEEVWLPDLLGGRFRQRTLSLGSDAEGEIVATLVRLLPSWPASWTGRLRDVDVLYVHGWSDYFFQTSLAQWWADRGARFYALDLRKYGRSLRPGQTPGYVSSLSAYDADIAAALSAMGRDERPRRRLVLLGHSTGGLTLSLWAARHPGLASALVLNSPWLEFQTGARGREALSPLVAARARWDPLGMHPVVDLGFYTRAQREVGTLPEAPDGWRPERGFPTTPGWLKAVLDGHEAVADGIEVGCPALVMLSQRSSSPLMWRPDMLETDSVLVVDDIAKAATRLGRLVTIARIDGALHDVFLSRASARDEAYRALGEWMQSQALR